GHGGLKEGQIINRLQEEYRKTLKKKITDEKVLETLSEIKENKPAVAKSKSGIMVKGINDVAVRFSKCCSPVPGDEIVGFVTRGRGVSIHRTDCVNVINLPEEDRVRLIDAEWSVPEMEEKKEFYEAEIKIYTTNRMGMLADISKTFTENKIDVTSMNVRTSKQGTATLSVGFQIKSVEHLHTVVKKLRGIEGIIDIERTSG
ncbi:MAG: ACT domain-containing protein, partial [Acetivibrio ethanolgignens]